MSDRRKPVIQAAGGVLWRSGERGREVAVVHRPRYDDWSLPKGKRKPSEELMLTAAREVREETGHDTMLGPYLGKYSYPVTSAGRPAVKTVKYWAMADRGGAFETNDEVDELTWLPLPEAATRVQFAVDRKVLRAFVRLPEATSVLLVVRNASAVRTSRRVAPDKRGLDRRGKSQAAALVPTLRTLGIDTLVSTTARRCLQTLQPYAAEAGTTVGVDTDLTVDHRHGGTPLRFARRLLDLAGSGRRIAVCADGELAGSLVASLGEGLGAGRDGHSSIRKGSWCLLHVGAGELLAIERHEDAA